MSSFDISFVRPRPDKKGLPTIKSLQRGDVSVNSATVNVAISAVDLTKTIVKITTYSGNTTPSTACVKAKLTTATNLELKVNSFSSTINCTYEIIEFNNIKTLQTGDATFTGGALSPGINSVNTLKCILFFSYTSQDSTASAGLSQVKGKLTNATSLTFEYNGTASITCTYYLVEFY